MTELSDLTAKIEAAAVRSSARRKANYAYARSLGFSSAAAATVAGWSRKRINQAAGRE